ncbi:hypothetical protein ACJRO7_030342 [Eucalyptus globulus]|uniref:Fungal lipase-type domain-containing protein n=1 Tax=Eucalyptus globulus TaxID=34317 RepID=A0ABD3JHC8_EUCGL
MDALCLKTGIHALPPSISVAAAGSLDARPGPNPAKVSALGRSPLDKSAASSSSSSSSAAAAAAAASSRFSFKYPLKSLWFGGRGGGGGDKRKSNGIALDDAVLVDGGERAAEEEAASGGTDSEGRSGNWVLKILHVRSLWKEEEEEEEDEGMVDNGGGAGEAEQGSRDVAIEDRGDGGGDDVEDEEDCDACRIGGRDDGGEKEMAFDRDSFSRLLRKVPLHQARLYAQMSYLGNLAYTIPEIKPANLLKYRGLRLITSSIEKRESAEKVEKEQTLEDIQEEAVPPVDDVQGQEQKINGNRLSASAAYQIAASAASYLHSHAKSIIPFNSSKSAEASGTDSPGRDGERSNGVDIMNPDMASLMATTDSVTAVVAAKEEVKQAVADDLKSTRSSPCEWFICDEDQGTTRFFVIQGSESLASWQANLLFEPIQFEGLDVLVHRGIYEAAKGIYEQMLPEVRDHLKSHGKKATFRFTGHSLGGSLSLVINLMLLIRGEVPASSLLPVITFGAPSIMCGGDHLLRKLGLPRSHVQSVTMHRDIVPRAFSCNYPNHVAEILKAVNGKFRHHPCLNNEKMLFAPMGELLILQPDEKFSPHHHLLPSGSGFYVLSCELSDVVIAEKELLAAQKVFLNSPHPLEILSDRAAYGSEGTIQRDHDMNSYVKSVRSVIRQELSHMRKAKREQRRKFWWPLIVSRGGINVGLALSRPIGSIGMDREQLNFSGILETGKESLKRFSRLVASQHMHLLVVILFPARLLLLGTYSTFN